MSTLGTVMPPPYFTMTDDAGAIVPGGQLGTFLSGTSTPAPTYADAGLTTPNTNPVIMNSGGYAAVFLTPGIVYRFTYQDSTGATIKDTSDGIAAVPWLAVGVGGVIHVFGGSAACPITDTLAEVGDTSYLDIDSRLLVGSYVLRGMVSCVNQGPTGTTTVDLVNFTDAPTTPIATIALSNGGALGSVVTDLKTSSVITFPAAGVVKRYTILGICDVSAGFTWGLELVRTA